MEPISGIDTLRALGDVELPDTRLSDEKRALLKQTARDIAEESNEHELMYLAGALEQCANLKRRSQRG